MFAFAPIPGPALLYGRMSTADQTVETQTDAMRGHLDRFIELQPAGEFTDPDTSGNGVRERFLNARCVGKPKNVIDKKPSREEITTDSLPLKRSAVSSLKISN